MITFKEYLAEHCKTGPYYGAFNMLQKEILETLYFDYLKDKIPGFDAEHIQDDSSLFMTYFERLPKVLEFLGDKLCLHIPDEKTIDHTRGDVRRWTDILFNIIRRKHVIDEL